MKNEIEILLETIINKPNRIQIWKETHNDLINAYSHGLVSFETKLNFYHNIKTWKFENSSFQNQAFEKNFMSLFVNVYYFDSDEEFRLQDASFTEIKIQHNGSKIKDFDVDIKNIEKLIRINRSNGNKT